MTRAQGTDRRFWPEAGGVAHVSLRGRAEGVEFTEGAAQAIGAPLADLRAAPQGGIDRQLPMGTPFRLVTAREGWAFGYEEASGYCGWLREGDLAAAEAPATHWVAAPASHLYAWPEVRATERILGPLPFLAQVPIIGGDGAFARIDAARWVPAAHLRPLADPLKDPVHVARMFLGAPYFWGGDSAAGIDCSGLIHAARRACGLDCPRDSDLQMDMPGEDVPPGAEKAGDLVFWRGHVALVSAPGRIIHANAHHMAVVEEPLAEAEARIALSGGPVLRRLRPHRSAQRMSWQQPESPLSSPRQ